MIAARITNISVQDGTMYVDYSLVDDKVPAWFKNGRFVISESDTQESIRLVLAAIIDKFAFVENLKPLISETVTSSKQ